MEYFRQYGRRIAVSIMGAILAVSLTYMVCMPAYAAEIGTIVELAEHVYETTDTGSNIVANVILGYNFPILAETADEAGNIWYLIETDMGVQGFIPAQSVIKITANAQNENAQGEDTQVQEPVSREENENENNLPESVKKQLLTLEVVNIRDNPSTNGEIVGKIPRETTLDYIDTVSNATGEVWYEVSYEDNHGFVKQSTVREIEIPVQGSDGIQPNTVGIAVGNINIDQVIETARQYQNESPAGETVEDPDDSEETQIQEQTIYDDDLILAENAGETKKKLSVLWPDMVIILSFAGILICAVIICQTYKRMMKLLRQAACRKG